MASRRRIIIIVFLVVAAVAVLALVIGLSTYESDKDEDNDKDNSKDKDKEDTGHDFNPGISAMEYFHVSDGLAITWYHRANSRATLKESLDGKYDMIEADIILRWNGLQNQTDEPIMAHPPDVDSDLDFESWMLEISKRNDKGMKLDFKTIEAVKPALKLMKENIDNIKQPVWMNADILEGPGSSKTPIDAQRFLSEVNEYFPWNTLSIGWTTGCCDAIYERSMVEEMWDLCKDLEQNITFPVRQSLTKNSWENLKWLLDQRKESFTLTIWTVKTEDDPWEGTSIWDMLYVRNDCYKTQIYYDLYEPKFSEFKQLATTAGDLYNYFELPSRDGLEVTWAHAVNSRKELDEALNDEKIMMLEADVLLRGQGLDNQTDIPVMAHPPATDSDLTLEQFLEQVLKSKAQKGIKLDFKSTGVLAPSMKILKQLKANFTQPIWLNADIFMGPGTTNETPQPVNATEFKRAVQDDFPEATLSVGWKTAWSNSEDDAVYTAEDVAQMAEYVKDLEQPITLPLRASMVKKSWPVFQDFLKKSRAYSVTIWTSKSDNVDPDDMEYIRQNSDLSQVYFDLPSDLLPKDIGDDFNPGISAMEYFHVSDGLAITWYHRANSRATLKESLDGKYDMIEADIILRWNGLQNQTDEPIMAHPPDVDSDLNFESWMLEISKRNDKGMKLDFKTIEAVTPALKLMKENIDNIKQPVWMNADILEGPGSSKTPIDAQRFLSEVNEYFPWNTLSIGWTTGCCDAIYERSMVEEMWDLCKDLEQNITFPVRQSLTKNSWENLKWLLDQRKESFTLTIWTVKTEDDPWEGTSIWDMLYVRNDCYKTQIYYDLYEPKFSEFKQLATTAGDLYNYFELPSRDGLEVTWAHAVNSRKELDEALNDEKIMMLEADVLLRGQGLDNQTDIPVMAHPPATDSDLTLEQFLEQVLKSKAQKGIKLDFKSTGVLAPSMKILKQLKANFTQPIWLNADIFMGPGTTNETSQPVNANEFKRAVQDDFPEATLSVGWKTAWSNSEDDAVYTAEDVAQMAEYVKDLEQPITLPLRASMVKKSWPVFQDFLKKSRAYSVTIWTSKSDNVDPEDMEYIRENSDLSQVYFDLPSDLLPKDIGDDFNPGISAMEYFHVSDGLAITWYHRANSRATLKESLDGKYDMIEADIILRWNGLQNQTDEPIMAHPPDVDSDLDFESWMLEISKRNDKGMKLDFKTIEAVTPALKLMKENIDNIKQPVWMNADILEGPGSSKTPIDAQRFLSEVNEYFPWNTLSIGWTTGCCDAIYERSMVEEMWDLCKDLDQNITFPVRQSLTKNSWENLKWLLDQRKESFTLTIWTVKTEDDPWEGTSIWDMLYLRNDCYKTQIYYDLYEPKFSEFKQLATTAGDLYNYFELPSRDGLEVTWAHAVNSRKELDEALNDEKIMMLEADVLLRGQGLDNQTDIPVMAHPPATDSDLTLEQFLEQVLKSKAQKGIKLDFKSTGVLAPSMKILKQLKANFTQPIWLNADIFMGPGTNNETSQPVNATEFKRAVQDDFPEATLSVGWKTAWSNSEDDAVYTAEDVAQMAEYVKDLKQPITLPLRASMVRKSWPVFQDFLKKSRAYSVTIWTSKSDNVDPDDMEYIRENSDLSQVYFDLPSDLLPMVKGAEN